MKIKSGFVLMALTFSTLAFAQSSSDQGISQRDRQLIDKLAQGDFAEIQMGTLAQQNGKDSAVKKFGERISKDHTALLSNLKEWASNKGLQLPTQPSSEQTSMFNQFSRMTGKTFDQNYMQAMLEDHQKDIKGVQQFLANSDNKDLSTLLQKSLPILENHLRVAENVSGRIGLAAEKGLNQPEYASR